MKKTTLILFSCLSFLFIQAQDYTFQAPGAPANPKVDIRWNKYYDYKEITDLCKKLAAAHPNLIQLESIGKSVENREIWLLTLTDFKTGNADKKPGFYIDGNIHSNEIQGTEYALYTLWYLAENFDRVDFVKQLLQEKVIYVAPTINPDARESYFYEANTAHSPRSGMEAIDDDGDGLFDEDGYDDLNGDKHITMMRRKSINGRYKIDPENPRRMIPAKIDEPGDYQLLGMEGLDNDGDGRVNEDRTGYYDPNRDWGWNWQPDYVQRGAYKYPFSLPENKAVADFVMEHQNIGGAQSYHNSGGMLLRGPGAEEDKSTYNRQDIQVYDALGKKGADLLPGYRYLTVYKDLYSVFGGELDWFYGGLGIFTFTNELWSSYYLFGKDYKNESSRPDYYKFDKYLLFEEAFVPWEKYNHPQYGEIEIGGFKKNFTRINPTFMIENDAHRNMAFTIYHAYQTPQIEVQEIEVIDLGGGLNQVTAVVNNKRMIPTHSSHDIKNKINRPDHIRIEGAKVLAGMRVTNRDLNLSVEQKHNPSVLEVNNIPGMGYVTVRWIISGKGSFKVIADSVKGGISEKQYQ